MKQLRKMDERGYSFLFVFLTIILVTVLGLSIIKIANNTLKTSAHERDDQSIYYIAEAGLNYGRAHFNLSLDTAFAQADINYHLAKIAYEQQPVGDPPNYKSLLLDELRLLGYPTDLNSSVTLDNTMTNLNQQPFKKPIFEEQFGQSPEANVYITLKNDKEDQLQYEMESTGLFKNTAITRTLQQYITISLEFADIEIPDGSGSNGNGGTNEGNGSSNGGHFSPKEYAVQTKGNIIVTGGGKITGNVASADGIIRLGGGASISGSIGTSLDRFEIEHSGLDKYKNQVNGSKNFPENVLAPFPSDRMDTLSQLKYPANEEAAKDQWNKTNIIHNGNFQADNWIANNYTLNLTGDTHFKQFKVDQNNAITINVGNSDKDLYIENLDIIQGHIKIIGTGKLNIYVKNTFNIKGSFNTGGDLSQVNFLYSGTTPLTLSNETQIVGSLYAKEADLTFSGGVGIKGNIFTGGQNVTFNGGFNSTSQYIIAPNATIKVQGGANIKGAIVADNILVDGGGNITFGESVVPPENGGGSTNPGENPNPGNPSPPNKHITEESILEK
ncbi:hypothetical protein ACIQXI_10385 [Lysinibacillus sp. NPDC097195]|uniref:DUF7305 domain-containing protein n=1 Tax=Lysinibacillus sp. NPDC097195 TaxID=3364141 RepID=UPI00382542AE